MKLVLFGAPGSGKGTQIKELADYWNLERISLGDILRSEVKRDSELGKKVKDYMNRGELVPDDVVASAVEDNLNSDNFILDGYPRNIDQAKHLEKVLVAKGGKLDAVINLEVDEPTVLQRLTGRRICLECNANYHVTNMPPKQVGTCDACGTALSQRNDDKEDVILNRWQVFLKESKPLIEFYKEKIISVDARGERVLVLEGIKKIIDNGEYLKQ